MGSGSLVEKQMNMLYHLRRNSGYHSLSQISALPENLSPSVFDKYASSTCCLEERGTQWKEKGTQTRMHRGAHTRDLSRGRVKEPQCSCECSVYSNTMSIAYSTTISGGSCGYRFLAPS